MEKRFTSPTDYLEKLRKKLLADARKYDVIGSYDYMGKQNDFSGSFDIDSKGKIVGEIVDPNSNFSKHIVDGEIYFRHKPITMKFVKIPPSLLWSRIYYSLIKSDEDKRVKGEYNGLWRFDEEAFNIDLNDPENQSKIKTHITLSNLS